VLDHYLASREDPRPFFFLQVGAYDGVIDDPLHERVREGNWHGILVEPQPSHFRRLLESYAGIEGLTFVNAAISEERGLRRMFVIQDEAWPSAERRSTHPGHLRARPPRVTGLGRAGLVGQAIEDHVDGVFGLVHVREQQCGVLNNRPRSARTC
jgi:Methyltransferase FkbM domain